MRDFNMLSMGLPTMFLLYKGVATLSPLHLHVMSSHLNMFCEKTCYSLDSWAQGLGLFEKELPTHVSFLNTDLRT